LATITSTGSSSFDRSVRFPDPVAGMLHGLARGPSGQKGDVLAGAPPVATDQPVMEAKDIKPLATNNQLHDAGLGRFRFQAELGQQGRQPRERGFGLRAGPAHHQHVVGACGVGTNSHKMRGRNGSWHRYYYCRNHDPIRAGGEKRRCPERNIRADALDAFVFDQIKAALTQPDLLLAGEQAVTLTTPIPDDELLAAELARLDRKIDSAEAERRRLVDLYQAGLIELPELQRRAADVTARDRDLQTKRTGLAEERATLTRGNQLRHRVHHFANRIRAVIDQLDQVQKQQLLRLLIDEIRVTGWLIQICLRIALDPSPPDPRDAQGSHHPPGPKRPHPLSSQEGCVPFVVTDGDSFRMKQARARTTPPAKLPK
jgi:Recombinase zinc beta ribbon domain